MRKRNALLLTLLLGLAAAQYAVAEMRFVGQEPGNRELLFLDAKGKELKRIKAGKGHFRPYFEVRKTRRKDRAGNEHVIEGQFSRSASSVKSGDGVLVIEMLFSWPSPVSSSEGGGRDWEGDDFFGMRSALEFYDKSGNLLWRTSLPQGLSPSTNIQMADDGRVISLIVICEQYCEDVDPNQVLPRLIVLNARGKVILEFPRTESDVIVGTNGHSISADGRYIATSYREGTTFPADFPKTLIIDTTTKRIWKSSDLMNVYFGDTKGPDTIVVESIDRKLNRTSKGTNLKELPWEPLP